MSSMFSFAFIKSECEYNDLLNSVASSYITNSHEETIRLMEKIMMVKGVSPSVISGPLATSILLGWKINKNGSVQQLSLNAIKEIRMEGITPKDVCFSGSEINTDHFKLAFQKEKYDLYRIKDRIDRVDFDNLPYINNLKTGDFLYLIGGSFSQSLVITKRMSNGALFSIMNIYGETIKEILIKEVELWYPKNKNGYFRDLAQGVSKEKAKTGLAGFFLWRRKQNAEYICEDYQAMMLRDELVNILREQTQGDWNICLHEFGKGEIFEWRKNIPFHCASTIKIPLSLIAMKIINQKCKTDIDENGLLNVLEKRGVDGRTYNQLLKAMVVHSEELATTNIVDLIKKSTNIADEFISLNMHNTSYEPRRSTQNDLLNCWRTILSTNYLDKCSRSFLLSLLGAYTVNDDLLIGEFRKYFPGTRQWNKRGIITKEFLTVQDNGIVEIPLGINNRFLYIGIAGTSMRGREISYESSVEFIETILLKLFHYIHVSELNKNLERSSNNNFQPY